MSTWFSQKERQKQAELSANNPPEKNPPDAGVEGVMGHSEILKEIKEFRMETAGNFGALKKEIKELREDIGELKTRMGAAELRIAEIEDLEIGMTKVLIHNLRLQKQLEAKCKDFEGRARRNNLRIYSVPEKCEGNNMIEFVKNLVREKLDITGEFHIERAHRATLGRTNDPGQ